MAYCSSDDVIGRLSQEGIEWQSDDPDSTADNAAMIDRAIEYAETKIDLAVQNFFHPTTQLHGNAYLKHLACAIAVWWVATRNAETAPVSVQYELEQSYRELAEIRKGAAKIPGATYPGEADETRNRSLGLPRVWNPGGR